MNFFLNRGLVFETWDSDFCDRAVSCGLQNVFEKKSNSHVSVKVPNNEDYHQVHDLNTIKNVFQFSE